MLTMQPLLVALSLLSVLRVDAVCPWDEEGLIPWSGGAATWGSEDAIPAAGKNIVITANKRILLDISPPSLKSLTIENGAALIWADVDGLTLKASFILVEGRFEIGSAACKFEKKATIILAGKKGEIPFTPLFDSKFLGVNAGGTLEFHGKDKLSWTKLIQTLPAGLDTCGVVYNHRKSAFGEEMSTGLHSIAFNKDGSVFDFDVFRLTDPVEHFQAFIDALPNNLILAVASLGDLGLPADRSWNSVYQSLETVGGLASSSSRLRRLKAEQAFVFMVDIGSGRSAIEYVGEHSKKLGYAKTERAIIKVSGLDFSASSSTEHKNVDFRVLTEEIAQPVIKVNNDVSSWEPGDKVVVTSTDWEWRQVEEFFVLPCPECAFNQVKLDHEAEYMHYGQVTFGVDERAEVALLTRNILIKGTLEEDCYYTDEKEAELCTMFNEDTFGGHFKMLKGFQSVHVEGCEFTQLGQQQVIGTYPIHFHMCDDVDGAWVRNNSIHNCKSRFITVHGTDGLELTSNVGYRTLGHGFFLEDSVEQRNILDGNIGIGVMHGNHLLSDRKREFCEADVAIFCDALSVYWLTHPNNIIKNNVAAGSDKAGFWYITSNEALSISNEYQKIRGTVPPMQAFYSQIGEFKNNVAHSHKERGMRVDGRISIGEYQNNVYIPENGIITATSSHYPHNPPQEDGELVVSLMDGFTAYRNSQNVWTKAGKLRMKRFTLADSPRGIAMARGNDMFTWTDITDSLFVGETDNLGMIDEPYGRSLTRSGPQTPLQGIKYYQGPSFVRNSYFTNYEERTWNGFLRPAGAISFKRVNPYPLTVNSVTYAIKFGFCDKTEGNWVFNGNSSMKSFETRDGTRQANFHDVDGSVTGHADTQVVNPHPFFTTPCCSRRDSWNLAVCPHQYAKLQIKGEGGALVKSKIKDYPTTLYRDDRPNDPFSLEGERGLIYLVLKGKSYIVNFNGSAPDEVQLFGQNMMNGDTIRVGLCFPKDVEGFTFSSMFPRMTPNDPMFSVDTIADLDSDTTGKAYFWDSATGLLFVKVIGFRDRQDGEKCPGYKCPGVTITKIGGSSATADCSDAAYKGAAPYKKSDDCSEPIPDPLPCPSPLPSFEGYGMPIVPSIEDDPVFIPNCPAPVTHPGRSSVEYLGCYIDGAFSDLPYHYQVLSRSMTPEFCVERCYHHGYVYAGLQNGAKCYCGNAYGVFGEDSVGCTVKCSGDGSKTCGGPMRNAVYSTGNAPAPAPPSCGPGNTGVEINGRCFYLGDNEVSFTEGERQCVLLGGHLATIDDEDTQDKLETYLRPSKSSAWIGLSDVVHEGRFTWTDGSDLGEYSNFMDQVGASDFVFLNVVSIFDWQVSSATILRRPLCLLSAEAPVTTSKCGTNDYGNRIGTSTACYLVSPDTANFLDSQYFCWTRNGRLAPIANKDEIVQHIHHFGYSGPRDYWVQGTDINGYTVLSYDKLFNEKREGKRSNNGAVCLLEDVDPATPCSSGWELFDGYCYLFSNYLRKSFNKAEAVCKQGISNMVTIHSQEENDFIINLVRQYTKSNSTVYLGFKYNAGSFKWVDGQPSDVNVEFWKRGHGLDNIDNGKCAKLRTDIMEWVNLLCAGRSAAVVCKVKA